jgi:ribose transport system substrate-binding protein
MKKKTGRALLVLLLTLLLAGCSFFGTTGETDSQQIEYQQFGEQKDNGQSNIYLITKGYGTNYWETLRSGAAAAAENYSCNLYVAGTPSESNLEILAQLMQDAIDAGADAIIISPADVPEIVEEAKQVKEAGIPLIFVDTILNSAQFDACYSTDNMQAGRLAAREMLRLLEKEGRSNEESLTVGIDINVAESQTLLERLAGFQEYWSNYAPESWKVLDDIKINGGDMDLAKQQGLEFQEIENLAGLVGLNNSSTVGLARSVMEQNRTDLALVGFDYSDEMKQMIGDEQYFCSSIVQRQYDMGYDSVEMAVMIIAGQTPECRYTDTGVQQVNHDNVDSLYIQEILNR